MRVEIDKHSGFCFGVVRAIETAQKELQQHPELCCLGDIVHNNQEVARLESLGLKTITTDVFPKIANQKVLLRAHGEPPQTYELAEKYNIQIIDATCPVVLKLQQRIKQAYTQNSDSQIVIFGKPGHAEVIGLQGQTQGHAIVVEKETDIERINPEKNVILFSQTTKSIDEFNLLAQKIRSHLKSGTTFISYDTICRQVANRIPEIRDFASRFDVILFVSGAKSSNGKILYMQCKDVNERTYLVTSAEDVDSQWLDGIESVGICGATSTPVWLMESVKERILTDKNR